jgi:hypothetical protein
MHVLLCGFNVLVTSGLLAAMPSRWLGKRRFF